MKEPDVVGYLHDCLKADRQGVTVWDVFAEKIKARVVVDGTERLVAPSIEAFVSLSAEQGERLSRLAKTYAHEEDLIYGSFFVCGACQIHNAPGGSGSRLTRLCAPLFFHPATVREEDGLWTLRIDPNLRTFNAPLLQALCGGNDLYLRLVEALGASPVGHVELGLLHELLAEALPDAKLDELLFFPELNSEDELRPRNRRRPIQVVRPGGVVFLAPKSRATLGTLNELQAIRDPATWSRPLRVLLHKRAASSSLAGRGRGCAPVPANLSAAQKKILEIAAKRDVGILIGPPGTGKSFTIACIILDHMVRGKSVLVVSQKDQAVNVVYDKVRELYGAKHGDILGVVRAGRSAYLRELKSLVEALLTDPEAVGSSVSRRRKELPNRVFRRGTKRLRHEARQLDRRLRREAGGSGRSGWWRLLLGRGQPPLVDLHLDFLQAQAEAEWLALERMHAMVTVRTRLIREMGRTDLSLFNRAIRARRLSQQLALFSQINFSTLLKALPVWLVNTSDLFDVLPPERELFDLVIIDESSQCDIASSLPALQRGKRALIVGDPQQLRHLSFLSRVRQEGAASQHGLSTEDAEELDYRDTSILDLADRRVTDHESVCVLNEYYRGLPPLIKFPNRMFYRDALRVMTVRPEAPGKAALQFHVLDSGDAPAMETGRNVGEAKAVVDAVLALVARNAERPEEPCPGIGVCSPFRNQVDFIERELLDALSAAQRDRFQLLVGTPHRFQGEERDVMFLSFAVDGGTKGATWRYLDTREPFNVAITRARREQHVFVSMSPKQMPVNSLLRAYLEHAPISPMDDAKETQASESPLIVEVRSFLEGEGLTVWNGGDVAGVRVDLMARRDVEGRGGDGKGDWLAIKQVGDSEAPLVGVAVSREDYSEVMTVDDALALLRAGITVIPISWFDWTERRERCVAGIRRMI